MLVYWFVRRYFEHVDAPQKRLFTFVNSAYSPIFEEPDRFMLCLDSALTHLSAAPSVSLRH